MAQPTTWKNLPKPARILIGSAVILSSLFGLIFMIGLGIMVIASLEIMDEIKQAYVEYLIVVSLWTLLILIFLRLPWLAWRRGWVQAAKAAPTRLALVTFLSLIALASALFGSTRAPEGDLNIWIDQLRLLVPFALAAVVFLMARSRTNRWVEEYGG